MMHSKNCPDHALRILDDLAEVPPRDQYELLELIEEVPAFEGACEIARRLGTRDPRHLRERTLRETLLYLLGRLCPGHQDEVLDELIVRAGGDALSMLFWLEADACRGAALPQITRRRESLEAFTEAPAGTPN